MTIPKRIEVKLECGHSLWFALPLPRPGDCLFCKSCDTYTEVFPTHASMGTMYMDTWKSTPLRKGFRGECTYEGCTEPPIEHRNWHVLEQKMHVHFMRQHTRFGGTIVVTVVDRLPPNSPPLF